MVRVWMSFAVILVILMTIRSLTAAFTAALAVSAVWLAVFDLPLAKCLDLEYRKRGITFHLFHPPLTRTCSSAPLPVPQEFMADPEKVGAGLAKRIGSRKFVICHSRMQSFQVRLCYLWPLILGRLMCQMTERAQENDKE